jgi:hypothetical protein
MQRLAIARVNKQNEVIQVMKPEQKTLIKNPVTVILVPKIQTMLCGVMYAEINAHDVVELVYTDNSAESALLTKEQLAAGRENLFSLVSAVQSYRLGNLPSQY